VRERAGGVCEYCRLPESVSEVPFHIEHIFAQQHRADDDPSNLALACDKCNRQKGTNLTSIDPVTDAIVALFHPRRDIWSDHFELVGATVVGITASGRTTAQLLKMNDRTRQRLRQLTLKDQSS
jgi:hypothetical protein